MLNNPSTWKNKAGETASSAMYVTHSEILSRLKGN